jgi:high-affinity Fe2+/Pb2+ permease
MTRFQALVITASFSAPVVVGLFLLVVNYFDNRAAAKQLKQKQADAARQTAGSALALSELSETEREHLKLHIETLEAFAETVKNASAIVEESSRCVRTTAAPHRAMENEKR